MTMLDFNVTARRVAILHTAGQVADNMHDAIPDDCDRALLLNALATEIATEGATRARMVTMMGYCLAQVERHDDLADAA